MIALCSCKTSSLNNSTVDYVPDEATAVRIAEEIFLPLLGKEDLEYCKPFKAVLINDKIWRIEPVESFLGIPPSIEIQKKDCRILSIYYKH